MNPNDIQQNPIGPSQSNQEPKNKHTKKAIISIIIVLLVFSLGLWVYISQTADHTRDGSDNPGVEITELEEIQISDDAVVIVAQDALSPETIRVRAGSTVTWSNESNVNFTLTSDPASAAGGLAGFNTNDVEVAPGDTFSFTFSTNGVYSYAIIQDGELSGTVIVD